MATKKKAKAEPFRVLADAALSTRIREAFALRDEIDTLEEQVKDKRALLKQIEENEIMELAEPEMFEKTAVVVVTEESGEERGYKLERVHYCGIKSEDRSRAHLWLEENGFGALLKRTVSVSLPKDTKALALALQNMLRTFAPHFEMRVVVERGSERLPDLVAYVLAELDASEMKVTEETELPGATLGSWVEKQYRSGGALPDFFNVYSPVRVTPAELPPIPAQTEVSADAAS